MDAPTTMARLAATIDAHEWDKLMPLLHRDFSCRLVHTGEVFDAPSWVRLNADYPGFDRLVLQDCVGAGDRAAARSHVTGHAGQQEQHFEVATFITLLDGLIFEITEVWTDVDQAAPAGTRPSSNCQEDTP